MDQFKPSTQIFKHTLCNYRSMQKNTIFRADARGAAPVVPAAAAVLEDDAVVEGGRDNHAVRKWRSPNIMRRGVQERLTHERERRRRVLNLPDSGSDSAEDSEDDRPNDNLAVREIVGDILTYRGIDVASQAGRFDPELALASLEVTTGGDAANLKTVFEVVEDAILFAATFIYLYLHLAEKTHAYETVKNTDDIEEVITSIILDGHNVYRTVLDDCTLFNFMIDDIDRNKRSAAQLEKYIPGIYTHLDNIRTGK